MDVDSTGAACWANLEGGLSPAVEVFQMNDDGDYDKPNYAHYATSFI